MYGPVVSGIITLRNESSSLGSMVSVMEKVVHGEQKREMISRKGGSARLWCFRHRVGMSKFRANRRGQPRIEIIFLDYLTGVSDRGGIGKRRPGCERRFESHWHIGDRERHFHGRRCKCGQAAALNRREVLAHRVDLVNRGSTIDQQPI